MKSLFYPVARFLGVAILLAGFCSLAVAEDPSRPPAKSLRPWKLAFVRDNNIWASNGDGTGQKVIIENGQSPAWSPDKSRIAFVRDNNIWVAKADGSGQRPVTSQWKKDDPKRDPRLSDGRIVICWHPKRGYLTFSRPEAFRAERLEEAEGAATAKKAAGGVIAGSSIFDVRLSEAGPAQASVRYDLFAGGTGFLFADHGHPAWSPSGGKLAFTRNGDIWVAEMKSGDGDGPPIGWEARRIAAVASYDEPTFRASRSNRGATRLSWHPDGRRLAYGYERLQGSGFNEVHLLDTKSGRDAVIAEDAIDPCFSPDGTFIAYWTGQCGQGVSPCVWAVSVDGKTRRKLVDGGMSPAW